VLDIQSKSSTQIKNKMAKKLSLRDQIKQRTEKNISKSRSGGGRTTYLDRFVDVLTDDKGNPVEPMTRRDIIAEISVQMVEEEVKSQVAAGDRPEGEPLNLTEEMNSEDDLMVADINRKVKAQVASAVANNNNSTSLSFNDKYKDKYEVLKLDGGLIQLAVK